MDNSNKTKTYFVVIVFIVIIFLSGYIVIDKIIKKNNELLEQESMKIQENLLKDSKLVTELSLDNKQVEKLYSYVSNNNIDYILYLNKNKDLSWDTKSFIVSSLIDSDSKSDYVNIDKSVFEKKYMEIFGDDIRKISVDKRISNICGGASFDEMNAVYTVKLDCIEDNLHMKTFIKNITYSDSMIKINKYYSFVKKSVFDGVTTYNVYDSNNSNESSLIAYDVDGISINNYIYKMKTISYLYKKDISGNYYLYGVE